MPRTAALLHFTYVLGHTLKHAAHALDLVLALEVLLDEARHHLDLASQRPVSVGVRALAATHIIRRRAEAQPLELRRDVPLERGARVNRACSVLCHCAGSSLVCRCFPSSWGV